MYHAPLNTKHFIGSNLSNEMKCLKLNNLKLKGSIHSYLLTSLLHSQSQCLIRDITGHQMVLLRLPSLVVFERMFTFSCEKRNNMHESGPLMFLCHVFTKFLIKKWLPNDHPFCPKTHTQKVCLKT